MLTGPGPNEAERKMNASVFFFFRYFFLWWFQMRWGDVLCSGGKKNHFKSMFCIFNQ